MSRMKLMDATPSTNSVTSKDEKLSNLILEYQETNSRKNKLNKVVNELNNQIKSIFLERQISEFPTADSQFIATVTTKEDTEFNEAKAIEILKANLTEEELKSVVKTKEYIDDDALENLIYNKQFDATLLAECTSKGKVTHILRVSKNKKEFD